MTMTILYNKKLNPNLLRKPVEPVGWGVNPNNYDKGNSLI